MTQPTRKRRPPDISVRYAEGELPLVRRNAEKAGLPVNTFIRHVTTKPGVPFPKIRNRYPDEVRVLLGKLLASLGNSRLPQNINQLAKLANQGALPVTPEVQNALFTACRHIEAIYQMIRAALGLKGGAR